MKQHTIILMGIQGSGKGTQVKLLEQHLQSTGESGIFRYETGSGFRLLAEDTSYTGKLVRESMKEGKLQPLFLTVSLWANAFIRNYAGSQHVIIDGFPRARIEAEVLHSALAYYNLLPATVINLELSDEIAYERMKKRGRDDDTDTAIDERISWFKSMVTPIITWYEEHPDYVVKNIPGAGDISEVHALVKQALPNGQ